MKDMLRDTATDTHTDTKSRSLTDSTEKIGDLFFAVGIGGLHLYLYIYPIII